MAEAGDRAVRDVPGRPGVNEGDVQPLGKGGSPLLGPGIRRHHGCVLAAFQLAVHTLDLVGLDHLAPVDQGGGHVGMWIEDHHLG